MSTAFSRTLMACLLAVPALGAVIGEPKKPYRDLPDDKPQTHVERITESRHEYAIKFDCTIDGTMTRMPIGYAAFVQGWQPNRSVLIENVGQTDVKNPRLIVNGKRNWRTLKEVVAEATRGYSRPSERARAIWEFVRRQRFHACTWDGECSDALKALNVYGYTLCGNQAQVINDLWQTAGLKTRRCYPIGHCVTEVFYDGGYHLLDSDEHVICLTRNNQGIASAEAIVRDHDLLKRTHTYGIGRSNSRKTDEFSASLYVYEGKRQGAYPKSTHHSMDFSLRPGESIEFRWDHIGKQYTAGVPRKKGQKKRDGLGDLLSGWGQTAYDNMRNGKLRYRVDLSKQFAPRGAETVKNAIFDFQAGQIKPVLRKPGRDASVPMRPASVTWRFAGPWVFVGGRATAAVKLAAKSSAEWRYSTDGKTWKTLCTVSDVGTRRLTASLDDDVSPRGRPTYRFWMQLLLRGDVSADAIAFDNDIQTSALSLPELELGQNRLVYTDATSGERQVRVTHRWLERTAWHPPHPPARAIAPKDGETIEGTRVKFQWSPAFDSDGDSIVDYHFELSEHPDMRWPLSPNFEKRTSLTGSKGKPELTVPYVGLLNPDTTYYWRVRALDAKRVWGAWSRTFRFRVQAPGVPTDLKLSADGNGRVILAWQPNPQGRPPVVYKVYGSDERGFTVSDTEYRLFRGKGFVHTLAEYTAKPADAPDAGLVTVPANLICRVSKTRLAVVGAELKLPNTNKAYYRVVAIDAAGNESGPSDCVEVPRPFVFTRPESTAKLGKPYRYQPRSIRSLGDLRCRRSRSSSYNAAYWDREEHTYKAIRLPDGLSMDPKTGLITGKPTRSGTFEIVFGVSDRSGHSTTVSHRLAVRE